VGIDDTWTGPAREGCPGDSYIRWRIEGLNGLAIGDIGWCKDPYTSPSSVRFACKGRAHFECPVWTESWFPDAFIGTMAQLLVAIENGSEPAISGHDNLKTMALVDAAYESAARLSLPSKSAKAACSRMPDNLVTDKPVLRLRREWLALTAPGGMASMPSASALPRRSVDDGTASPAV
jgi:hypothetical protein